VIGTMVEKQSIRSRPSLPELGLGTAALGGMFTQVSADEARALLHGALELGLRYIDTAPMYGLGTAERRVGAFLDDVGDAVQISTKVGRRLEPASMSTAAADTFGWRNAGPYRAVYDYTYDGVLRSVEDSLQRLGRDRVEVLYVHDIGRLTHGPDNDRYLAQLRHGGGFRALDELRTAGVTGAIGLGVNEADVVLECLDDADLDYCLLANQFTLLEQPATDLVYEETARRGVRLIAAGIFNSSVLAGGSHYRYGDIPAELAAKLAALREVCEEVGVSLQAAAVQFVERSGRYASMLLGSRTVAELTQVLEWRSTAIPEEFWHRLVERRLLDARWLPRPTSTQPTSTQPASLETVGKRA
jgi:D-threo-aldose 1-dehydrogenase